MRAVDAATLLASLGLLRQYTAQPDTSKAFHARRASTGCTMSNIGSLLCVALLVLRVAAIPTHKEKDTSNSIHEVRYGLRLQLKSCGISACAEAPVLLDPYF